MTKGESAWLARVIDGEGAIFLSRVTDSAYRRGFYYRPQIGVSNSARAFLVRVLEVVGEGTVSLAKRGDRHTKTRWEYQGASGILRAILPQVVSYLIIKRATAEKMLEYLDYSHAKNSILGKKVVPPQYYENLDSLYLTIKRFNEKGKAKSRMKTDSIII